MNGKTHVAIGMAAALTISAGQPLERQLGIIAAAAISSLIPDLDHPKGKLNQKILLFNNKFYRTLFYLSLGSVFMYLYFSQGIKPFLLLGITSFLIGVSTHRGFTHSILGFLISTFIVALGTVNYGLSSIYSGFIIGYVLHLIGDFFTPKGIKLFYPLNYKISSPVTIRTNSKLEGILVLVLSVYSIYLLLGYY